MPVPMGAPNSGTFTPDTSGASAPQAAANAYPGFYMGSTIQNLSARRVGALPDYLKSATVARESFINLPKDQLSQLDNSYKGLGFKTAKSLWGALVGAADAKQRTAGTEYTSPWDILNYVVANGYQAQNYGTDPTGTRRRRGPSGNGPSGAGYGGTSTQSQTSANLTDATTAHGIANNALDQYLGRDANPAEQARFKQLLNSDESAHPTTTTATTTVSGGPHSSSSTSVQHSGGGTSAAQDAIDFAKSRPDYAEYQYATTYQDAFNAALGTPVSGT